MSDLDCTCGDDPEGLTHPDDNPDPDCPEHGTGSGYESFTAMLERHGRNSPPANLRDYWPWLFERGGAIHRHEQKNFRLSGRETRFTDDEVREDCAVFAVIGRDKIDAIEKFIRDTFGGS